MTEGVYDLDAHRKGKSRNEMDDFIELCDEVIEASNR